jgi:carbon monoxide dehydrogenase subunit G
MRWVCAMLLVSAVARADGPDIQLTDLPGTNGEWQEGAAIIPAPREKVLEWLTDYAAWPERFPDIAWAQVLPDDAEGRHVIKFRSRIAEATLTVHEAVSPGLLVFEGSATFAYTQGRIHLIDLGNGTTRVLMQSTAQARGIAKLFATKALKRKRAHQVSTSHLLALWYQAQAFRKWSTGL